MLGASKRNLFSANYAMLVITETTVKTLGTGRCPVCRHRSNTWPRGPITQQHLVLLPFLQVAIPQRLAETHDYFKIHPTRHDWVYWAHERVDHISSGSGLQTYCFNCRLHKCLCRGLIQSRLLYFCQFCSYKVWHDTLHKDALALILLMEALREEIYKGLGCRVDCQQWNWEHATGWGDVENHPFRSGIENTSHKLREIICTLLVKCSQDGNRATGQLI